MTLSIFHIEIIFKNERIHDTSIIIAESEAGDFFFQIIGSNFTWDVESVLNYFCRSNFEGYNYIVSKI